MQEVIELSVSKTAGHLVTENRKRLGWPAVFVGLVAGSIVMFSAFPGTVEGKSLAVLHGLCAQQPSHSYYFGEARLPFDARMTGIYLGIAVTTGYLLLRGRWRAGSLTDLKVVVALAVMIVPLAIDGVNSFLKDLDLPYLYEPFNLLRTLTGLLVGTALASFVWMLIAQTAFIRTSKSAQPIWHGLPDLMLALLAQLAIVGVIGTSWWAVRVPLTYLLMLSAAAVLTGLLLPFVLLATRRENAARDLKDLAAPATLALVVALLFMGATAGGRFLLEVLLGLPSQVSA